MVLAPRAEDADFLNINRPVFARRGLKVVLWCDEATTLALARNAVDFFDWISRRHECPPGVPMHAVYGIRAALCARAPQIVWMGGDLEACFRAALPGRKLMHLDMARPLPELEREVRSAGRAWIVWHSHEMIDEWILPHVLHEGGRWTRVFMIPSDDREGPFGAAMMLLEGECDNLHSARRTLGAAGYSGPGRIAALIGLERAAIEVVAAYYPSTEEHALLQIFSEEADPGAFLARLAGEEELESRRNTPFGGIPAIEVRAFGRGALMRQIARGVPLETMKERARLMVVEIAASARALEDLDAAETLARQAFNMTARLGNAVDHILAQHTLAMVLARRGRFEEAEEHLRHALSTRQSLGASRTPGSASLLGDLADVLTDQGRYPEAEELVLQELDELGGGGPSLLLKQAEQRLAHLRELIARGRGGSEPA